MDIKTLALSKKYTGTRIAELADSGFKPVVVETLPAIENANSGTVYLVPAETNAEDNKYLEYIIAEQKWECVGTTAIDLSDYPTIEAMNIALSKYLPTDYIPLTKSYLQGLGFESFDFNVMPAGVYAVQETISYQFMTDPSIGGNGGGSGSFKKGDTINLLNNTGERGGYFSAVIYYAETYTNRNDEQIKLFINGLWVEVLDKTKSNTITAGWTFNEPITYRDRYTGGNLEITKSTQLVTKEYVDNQIIQPTSVSLTGEELDVAVAEDALNVGDTATCTENYVANDNSSYLKGHTYAIKEQERGEVSIADQLRNLGFTVNIESNLESYGIKYFYIVEYGDEGAMLAAYSKVPLNVSNSKFPSSGWKTFSVRKMNSSDPNFYYAQWNTNKNLSTMTELTSSTNDGLYWSSQFSSTTNATYSNDPNAAAYTKYVVDPTDMIKYVEDITPGGEGLVTEEQVGEMLNNYYTSQEVDNLIYSAVGEVEYKLDAIIEGE